MITKQMTKQAQAKGGMTKGAQITGAQAKRGMTKGAQIKGGQHATTRSLTRIDVNPSNVTVVDVGILLGTRKRLQLLKLSQKKVQ